jgi:hypothetical protein
MRYFILFLAVVISCAGVCYDAYATGELLLRFGGPILRGPANTIEDPLCGLPEAFPPSSPYTSATTFDDVVEFVYAPGVAYNSRMQPYVADEDLLRSSVNLALARGIDEAFPDANKWRIVAFRVDQCEEDGERPLAPRAGIKDCHDQFRLVAQPFSVHGIYVVAHDLAFHLIYDLPNKSEFLKVRQELDEDASRRTGLESAQALLNSASFHCGLAINDHIKSILDQFARPERLRSLSWMASSASGQHWTFGRFVMESGHLIARPVSGNGYFDNFSKPLLLTEKCAVNADAPTDVRAALHCNARNLTTQVSSILDRIRNPKELTRSENLCVACHLAKVISLVHAFGIVNDKYGLPIFAPNGVDLSNLRQFGFDHNGYPTISERIPQDDILRSAP